MDDALLTLLISETVNGVSPTRRRAAVLLIRAIRLGSDDAGASVEKLLPFVSAADGAEIIALCDHYGIPKISN